MDHQIRAMLPAAFAERMRESLGAEAEAFFASYGTPRAYGLRCNPLKTGGKRFEELMPFSLSHVPWAREGYYYRPQERPGKHYFHEMGLYYIQEPSAMCVAEIADPQPGERVLDLCAAPGGKATQLAGRLGGEGLLVCNEPVQSRAKILSRNIERMGVTNAVVLNHTPQELALRFPAFFDRIVVDAPCSGEGMFHKEEAALAEWSPETPARCAMRQREILSCAAAMLRPGGTLVYSTCTFAPEENEEMVDWLLAEYPGLHPAAIDTEALGVSGGGRLGTARIYPHRQRGEGHFAAKLQKDGVLRGMPGVPSAGRTEKKGTAAGEREIWQAYECFAKEHLLEMPRGRREVFGEQLYLVPEEMPDIGRCKVLRPGLHLGTSKKNRFEPSHGLALALQASQVRSCFETDEPERYLRGETLSCGAPYEGWTLVTCQGFPMGWGKASRGVMKNHYPKGLRVML